MRKTITRVSLLFLLFIIFSTSVHAQFKWEMGSFIGVANYQGDFVEGRGPIFKESNFAFGILGRYNLNYNWAARGGIIVGKITGRDLNSSNAGRKARGGSFSNVLKELSFMVEWEPMGEQRYLSKAGGYKRIISPYAFGGIGLLSMKPNVTYINSELTGLAERIKKDENADYFNTRLTIPFGIGVRLDLSESWSISVEVGMRYAFTDYLDGVSIAGTSENRDWYNYSGVTIFHRLQNTHTTFAKKVRKKKMEKMEEK